MSGRPGQKPLVNNDTGLTTTTWPPRRAIAGALRSDPRDLLDAGAFGSLFVPGRRLRHVDRPGSGRYRAGSEPSRRGVPKGTRSTFGP
jgi:hypothetical protein